jgi:NAD(P)-dependent dehydrogenase (short-subunit alcohol dehydrogenase family)
MNLPGKTVLITGATDGLGRALAIDLAEPGSTLILHGRNVERGEEVRRAVEAKGAQARFHRADFASLKEVERLAETMLQSNDALHLLVNNAGIGFGHPFQGRQVSADGYELRFAVNFLAPVLLTNRLRPLLKTGAPARIVNVASIGQYPIDFADLMLEQNYSGSRAYRRAKLAMIMWTFDLEHELGRDGVSVNAVHPATFMNTSMVRQGWGIPLSSVSKGVEAVRHLATSDAVLGITGSYFEGTSPATAHAQAYDVAARQALREAVSRLLISLELDRS